jgi:phosphoglycerate kinase
MPKKGMILDIGPESVVEIAKELRRCKTVVWNGPMGAFEYPPFNVGTVTLARTVASLTRQEKLISVAGGGDVLSALTGGGLKHAFSYISTAGGAFLEWLEGKELPGVKVLREDDKQLQAMGVSA